MSGPLPGGVNCLPNLELLAGQANVEKQSTSPSDWLASGYFTRDEQREAYLRENDLTELPGDITGFLEFYEGHKARMRNRLAGILGAATYPIAGVLHR